MSQRGEPDTLFIVPHYRRPRAISSTTCGCSTGHISPQPARLLAGVNWQAGQGQHEFQHRLARGTDPGITDGGDCNSQWSIQNCVYTDGGSSAHFISGSGRHRSPAPLALALVGAIAMPDGGAALAQNCPKGRERTGKASIAPATR